MLSILLCLIFDSARSQVTKKFAVLPSINQTIRYVIGLSDTIDELIPPQCQLKDNNYSIGLYNISSPYNRFSTKELIYPLFNLPSSLFFASTKDNFMFIDKFESHSRKIVFVNNSQKQWRECTDAYYRPDLRRLFTICKGNTEKGPHYLLLIEANDYTGNNYKKIELTDFLAKGSLKIVNTTDSLLIFSTGVAEEGLKTAQRCTGMFSPSVQQANCKKDDRIYFSDVDIFLTIHNVFKESERTKYFIAMGSSKDSASLVFRKCELQFQTKISCDQDSIAHTFSTNPLVFFLPGYKYFELDQDKNETYICDVARNLNGLQDKWFSQCEVEQIFIPENCEIAMVNNFQNDLFISFKRKSSRFFSCGFSIKNMKTKEVYFDEDGTAIQWEDDIITFKHNKTSTSTSIGIYPTSYLNSLIVNKKSCLENPATTRLSTDIENNENLTRCAFEIECRISSLTKTLTTFDFSFLPNSSGKVSIDPSLAKKQVELFEDSFSLLPTHFKTFKGNDLKFSLTSSESLSPFIQSSIYHTYNMNVTFDGKDINVCKFKDIIFGDGYAFTIRELEKVFSPVGIVVELFTCHLTSLDTLECIMNKSLDLPTQRFSNRRFCRKCALLTDGVIFASLCDSQNSIVGVVISSPLIMTKFIPFNMIVKDIDVFVIENAKVLIAVATPGQNGEALNLPSVYLYLFDMLKEGSEFELETRRVITHIRTQSGFFCPDSLQITPSAKLVITSKCLTNGVSTDFRLHYVDIRDENGLLEERPLGTKFTEGHFVECGSRLVGIGSYLNEEVRFATSAQAKSSDNTLIGKGVVGGVRGRVYCHKSTTAFTVVHKGAERDQGFIAETYITEQSFQADNWLNSRIELDPSETLLGVFSLKDKVLRLIQTEGIRGSLTLRLVASEINGPLLYIKVGKLGESDPTEVKGELNVTVRNREGEQESVVMGAKISKRQYSTIVTETAKINATTNVQIDIETALKIQGGVFEAEISADKKSAFSLTKRIHMIANYQPILPIQYTVIKYFGTEYLIAAGYKNGYLHLTVLKDQKYFDSMIHPLIGAPDFIEITYAPATSSINVFFIYNRQVFMLSVSKLKPVFVELVSSGVEVVLCEGKGVKRVLILKEDGRVTFGRVHSDKGWVEDTMLLMDVISVSAHMSPEDKCHFVMLNRDMTTIRVYNSSTEINDGIYTESASCSYRESLAVSKIKCKYGSGKFYCIANTLNNQLLETVVDFNKNSCTTYEHDKESNLEITSINSAGSYLVGAVRGMRGTEWANYRGLYVWRLSSRPTGEDVEEERHRHIFYHLNMTSADTTSFLEFDMVQSATSGKSMLAVSSLGPGSPLCFYTISNFSLMIKQNLTGLEKLKLILYKKPELGEMGKENVEFSLSKVLVRTSEERTEEIKRKRIILDWENVIILILVSMITILIGVVWFKSGGQQSSRNSNNY